MEEKALSKPTMVSRLPKFGARAQGGTSALPNGTATPLQSQEGKGVAPGKPNGVARLPSAFSLRWKKGGGSPTEGAGPERQGEEGRAGLRAQPQQQAPAARELKKPSAPVSKVRRPAPSANPTAQRTIPQPSRTGPRGASAQAPRPVLNGVASRFGLGLQRTGSNPDSGPSAGTHGGLRDGLSQSTDSLKSLSSDSMVRSQSFTHFRQLPSPSAQPITRSFSLNRAELARPPASGLVRTKNQLLKPTSAPGAQCGKSPAARPGGGALKKPLLPSCLPSKSPALAYRLTRPSLVKQARPLLAGQARGDQGAKGGSGDSVETSPGTPDPPSQAEKLPAPEIHLEELTSHQEVELSARYLGEGLEDMSLSSTSSLERNDTSEEYMDDFDNLGNGGGMLLFPPHDDGVFQTQPHANDNAPTNGERTAPTQTRLCSFLTDTVDWAGRALGGGKEDHGILCGHDDRSQSPERDLPHGSSLDLSPSDSSGGTYMWDEEGLEPLGTTIHPCGSYDSDLNSLDILNNLDNLESCDLEDDDLMLDVDLPEDGSLHSDADGMSHFERTERGGRQGHWRRRQHRWSGPDHFHNDNRGGGFQQFDGRSSPGTGKAGTHPLQGRHDGHMVALDELTLRHMAEDCTSVKSQLLKLKKLLQMEDGGTIQDALELGVLSPEPREDPSAALQAIPTPPPTCQCQHRRPEARGERRSHHDKATQTPWRGHAPQVLQPPSPWPSECLTQGRLARTAPTADPSERARARAPTGGERPRPVSCPDASVSLLLRSHLRLGEGEEGVRHPGAQPRPPTTAPPPDRDHAQGRPRILQSLRLHKKVSVPTLPQEGAGPLAAGGFPGERAVEGRANPMPGSAALLKKRQLPPPSRGLPSFSSASQASGLARAPTLLAPPRTLGLREPENGLPKAGGLIPPNHSRLPKPKIH
ncbi:serine-rich coiled-coil domain-containing protein 2-like isoform X2 [Megalops cyprinoides]|uniref:serine-rich coiled-coil domain-containing protein 2-like isoform X2 n=1 Tax=Megalops cyprinoides TaxID=118141 RepID=UPI0018642ABC|nr:serine-rich coiled-coil domain-containing protein 2-like isoform X2 [Megalops cyprinoides]